VEDAGEQRYDLLPIDKADLLPMNNGNRDNNPHKGSEESMTNLPFVWCSSSNSRKRVPESDYLILNATPRIESKWAGGLL